MDWLSSIFNSLLRGWAACGLGGLGLETDSVKWARSKGQRARPNCSQNTFTVECRSIDARRSVCRLNKCDIHLAAAASSDTVKPSHHAYQLSYNPPASSVKMSCCRWLNCPDTVHILLLTYCIFVQCDCRSITLSALIFAQCSRLWHVMCLFKLFNGIFLILCCFSFIQCIICVIVHNLIYLIIITRTLATA